jgi:hypothetical protein
MATDVIAVLGDIATMHAMSSDTTAAVDALMRRIRHPAEKQIEILRETILQVNPSIREGVKWNAPSFRTHEYFATTNLRAKAGVGVILHFGAKVRKVGASSESIKDPQKLLQWLAKDRATVSFADANDLSEKKEAFQAILRQWIAHV